MPCISPETARSTVSPRRILRGPKLGCESSGAQRRLPRTAVAGTSGHYELAQLGSSRSGAPEHMILPPQATLRALSGWPSVTVIKVGMTGV